jgi:hypothetical protein
VRKTKNLKGDTFMFKKIACSTLIGVALTAVTAVQAQTAFPAKAIRIVVPFAAGGTSDILARTIGQKLTESWGQPVVVDNRAGCQWQCWRRPCGQISTRWLHLVVV